jgi:tRNA A-37 threonylcarbamoyl transferase component Bud32
MSSTESVTPGDGTFDGFPLAAGDVLDERFEILRPMGRGGFATVYSAYDRVLRKTIAIKVLNSDRMSEKQIARMKKEVSVALHATSTRLVRIYDLHRGRDHVYLTMELVDGGSLRDAMLARTLTTAEVIKISTDIARALADLEHYRIVHRDLKPGNLLLTTSGQMKIGDFGLAFVSESKDDNSSSSEAFGTRGYLAPEQLGLARATVRSDLYSLGVVIYEMLTGHTPSTPSGDSRRAEIRAARGDVPAWLISIITRLLEPDPRRRYGSASALLRDLQKQRATMPLPKRLFVAAAILVLLASVFWRVREIYTVPSIVDAVEGVRAVSAGGATLWGNHDVDNKRLMVAVHRGLHPPLFATVLRKPSTFDNAALHRLSFLDSRTGAVVSTVQLPDAGPTFRTFSPRFAPAGMLAADLDGDGYDEVIVSYVHATWWPCYSVVYDLRRNEARIVFLAGGHQLASAAVDVDGDGHKEVLFAGISNRLGWDIAVAAVRVDFDRFGSNESIAMSPDGDWMDASDAPLAWYALAPRGRLASDGRITVDEAQRTLTLHYIDRAYALDFDGFARSTSSKLPAARRAMTRRRGYRHLREADRLAAAGTQFGADALREIDAAASDAAGAGDDLLREWSLRRKGSILIGNGRLVEANELFTQLAAASAVPGDIAWDAASAFHLKGNLDRAIHWYRLGYGRGAESSVGRLKFEFFQGLVLALGEEKRWNEAIDEVDRFEELYPGQASNSRWYRQYIVWRRGGIPTTSDPTLTPPDIIFYWAIEFGLANGEPPQQLLARADEYLGRVSESRAMLLSVKAELLDHVGRRADAARMAAEAYATATRDRASDVGARAHFDIIEQRYKRLAQSGKETADALPLRAR